MKLERRPIFDSSVSVAQKRAICLKSSIMMVKIMLGIRWPKAARKIIREWIEFARSHQRVDELVAAKSWQAESQLVAVTSSELPMGSDRNSSREIALWSIWMGVVRTLSFVFSLLVAHCLRSLPLTLK